MIPPIRKANADDEDADLQATMGGNAPGLGFKIRPPPIGAELDKDAQVWEIYVDETDRSDREMVKGWTESLDVLLVFAALFSAITTALVIESSKQLQSDPAETSTQLLMTMSQTLIAISNGQAVDIPILASSATSGFAPPRSSVLVNALWFLSLTLSVAVSLVAMVSKSWCYMFMSNRSGPKYEQGRRRQKKWDGIERWGMESVFVYLPTLMHLALLLFAIGLCVYLWNVSVPVAIPVLAVTTIFISLYAVATVLPSVHIDCPYSTPLSKPLARAALLITWESIVFYFLSALKTALGHLKQRLQSRYIAELYGRASKRWSNARARYDSAHSTQSQTMSDPGATPMDDVTSHMIVWMITNCEDSRLVDVALQSIAGARHEFPWSTLAEAHVTEILAHRLDDCIVTGTQPFAIYLKPTALIESALLYAQALCRLLVSNASFDHEPFSQLNEGTSSTADGALSTTLKQKQFKLFELFVDCIHFTRLDSLDPNLAAIAISLAVTLNRPSFRRQLWLSWDSCRGAITTWSNQLMQHHLDGTRTMDGRAFLALLEATPLWMIDELRSMNNKEQSNLFVPLIQLVHSPSCSAPDVQHAIGLALTTAAFIMHQYPGGEHPVHSTVDSTARAIKVHHYHNTQYHEEPKTLIAFGLLGLLDKSEMNTLGDNEVAIISSALTRLGDIRSLPQDIHTLPETLTLTQYAKRIIVTYLKGISEDGSTSRERGFVSCLTALIPLADRLNNHSDIQVTLGAFCASHNSKIQRVCSKALNRAHDSRLEQVDLERLDPTLFNKLIDISIGDDVYIAPTAMRFLWSLTDRLMKKVNDSLNERLAESLSQILKHDAFVSLRARTPNLPTSPRNICEVGFADMWYLLLREMSSHKATASRTGVLYSMYQSYDEQGMQDAVPYLEELRDGRSWYQMLKELYDMPIPDEVSL